MRTLICTLFTLLLFFYKPVFAQSNLQVNILNNQCDSIYVQTNAFFTFGTLGTCPPLVGYAFDTSSDYVSLYLYYNISGFWPAHFCNQIDTLLLIIPPNTTTLSAQAFSIVSSDTSLSPDANTIIPVCITGISNISRQNENVLIKPNPVEGILNIEVPVRKKIKMVSIHDVLGNVILKKANSIRFDVSGLKTGIYLINIETDKGIYKKKFLKK